MKTVAIICEYNPFHYGHEYQIKKIREELGIDTAVISIMSGNFTQRGNFACLEKGKRAICAIKGGVDLVLELPFPYSSSSAEIFAAAAVKIADSLGNIDYLSFGSESGDIQNLKNAANVLLSDEYKKAFIKLSENKSIGYPEKCEAAFKAVSDIDISFTPNNILAIEYIKALKNQNSKILPHTIKRRGASYNDKNINDCAYPSAMAVRNIMKSGINNALSYLPDYSGKILQMAQESGDAPTDEARLNAALISYLRLNPPKQRDDFYDANDGLYNRLYNASFKANDIHSLLEFTETKKFTSARLRRALWNVFFGVTSSDVKTFPMFTQVLAMNKKGMALLKNFTKRQDFRILTKPSDFEDFSPEALKQKMLSDKADSIFELSKPNPKSGKSSLTFTPYIEK